MFTGELLPASNLLSPGQPAVREAACVPERPPVKMGPQLDHPLCTAPGWRTGLPKKVEAVREKASPTRDSRSPEEKVGEGGQHSVCKCWSYEKAQKITGAQPVLVQG